MKHLKFSNPVFNDGLNVTVRRGTKWSDAEGIVQISEGKTAKIDYVQVMRFQDIQIDDITCEHDPSCRNVSGLFAEMERLYPCFHSREIVTLVYFTPTINEA